MNRRTKEVVDSCANLTLRRNTQKKKKSCLKCGRLFLTDICHRTCPKCKGTEDTDTHTTNRNYMPPVHRSEVKIL